jgi:hypothetical protein
MLSIPSKLAPCVDKADPDFAWRRLSNACGPERESRAPG